MCLGIPGQITRVISARERRAEVAINGVRREVNIACIADAEHPAESCVGDWVLVHVGVFCKLKSKVIGAAIPPAIIAPANHK